MITERYDLATHLRAVDSCLASTASTQGNSPLSRFELINSPLDELSWDDYLTIAEIEGRLMVKFGAINKMVIMDESNNEIEFIKTNPLNLERVSTISVKEEDEDCKPSVLDLLDSSGDEISANALDVLMGEKQIWRWFLVTRLRSRLEPEPWPRAGGGTAKESNRVMMCGSKPEPHLKPRYFRQVLHTPEPHFRELRTLALIK